MKVFNASLLLALPALVGAMVTDENVAKLTGICHFCTDDEFEANASRCLEFAFDFCESRGNLKPAYCKDCVGYNTLEGEKLEKCQGDVIRFTDSPTCIDLRMIEAQDDADKEARAARAAEKALEAAAAADEAQDKKEAAEDAAEAANDARLDALEKQRLAKEASDAAEELAEAAERASKYRDRVVRMRVEISAEANDDYEKAKELEAAKCSAAYAAEQRAEALAEEAETLRKIAENS